MEIKSAEQRREKGKQLYGTILNAKIKEGDKVFIIGSVTKGDKEIATIKSIQKAGDYDHEDMAQIAFRDGRTQKVYLSDLELANALKNGSADKPIIYKGYTITASSDESEWIVTKSGKDLYHGNSAQDCKDWIDRR